MRIKDSPKNNVEGGSKKEVKKKNSKQRTENNGTAIGHKNEKSSETVKTEKENSKRSPAKEAENEVYTEQMNNYIH